MFDGKFEKHVLSDLKKTPKILFRVFENVKLLKTDHLKSLVEISSTCAIFCVMETCAAFDVANVLNAFEEGAALFRSEKSFDGILIVIDTSGGSPRLLIHRTQNATVPIYIGFNDTSLIVSWDYWSVINAIGKPTLNIDMCRHYIMEGPSLYRKTIIEEISLLSGGQSVCWDGKTIAFTENDCLNHFDETTLCPGAEVTNAFLDLIERSICFSVEHALLPVLEMSGGQDSSCVAIALARMRKKETVRRFSYGLIHDGVVGKQQTMRRSELISKFDFEDVSVPSSISRPFTNLSNDNQQSILPIPFDEIYRRGIEACLDRFSDSSLTPDLVLTGIGGDELTLIPENQNHKDKDNANASLHSIEQRFFGVTLSRIAEMKSAPLSSAVVSAFCRADMFLRRGIWVKNPFIDPQIVTYGQMIPETMKIGRLLNLLTLAREGMSDFFLFPRFKENFRTLYEQDLREFDFDVFFESSLLHSLQIMNIGPLCRAFRQFINFGKCEIPMVIFMNAVRLEGIIRRTHA